MKRLRCSRIVIAAVVLIHAGSAYAQQSFQSCLSNIADQARQDGVGFAVIETVLGQVEELPQVLANDGAQPEFTSTFAGYYPRRVTRERVAMGREMLGKHADLLQKIQNDTGVPPQYIVAFWGLETNYGNYLGTHSVPSALATLACKSRRAEYFAGELIQAMKIIERGDVEVDDMIGSWAGAMGYVQFMPTTYLNHAIDADGDGRRDLWTSTADALASAGRFLQSLGWQAGLRWGREVLVPASFDYQELGTKKPLSYWHEIGITDVTGKKLPPIDVEATLILPAGYTGPMFVVYDNFDVIMDWNRSEFYALSVGRLADRISGSGSLTRPVPSGPKRWKLDAVRNLQEQLIALGHSPGEADGFFGPATRKALATFQASVDLVPDGYPSAATRDALASALSEEG